jgi:hypothetical protein
MPQLKEVRYEKNFVLWLRFSDGSEGCIDFAHDLTGEIFKPLKDKTYFKKFKLDEDLMTVVWPNGADFAPEFLYERVRKQAKRVA